MQVYELSGKMHMFTSTPGMEIFKGFVTFIDV